MNIEATYFDGKSARDRKVDLRLESNQLIFSGDETTETIWDIKGLHPIDRPSAGQPFRLTHDQQPGARLVIRDDEFVRQLLIKSSHLKGGYSWGDIGSIASWTIGSIAVMAGLSFATLTFLPDRVAHVLPDSWRNRIGKQMEEQLVAGAKLCSSKAGDAAIGTIVARLAEGSPDLPPISVHIYDMPIMNAFAVSGGNIVITRELINASTSADEVAGVLAHEVGHVAHLHPEAQMVRIEGMQILSSLFTGKSSGGTMSNVAGIAALLTYSRAAERDADIYANEALIKAKINPAGLKSFFEKVVKLESDATDKSGTLSALGNLFATHPGTEERINDLRMMPFGEDSRPTMTDDEWKALKKICG